jgi:hypothetical protein
MQRAEIIPDQDLPAKPFRSPPVGYISTYDPYKLMPSRCESGQSLLLHGRQSKMPFNNDSCGNISTYIWTYHISPLEEIHVDLP